MERDAYRKELAGLRLFPTLEPQDRRALLEDITAHVRHILIGVQKQYPGSIIYDGESSDFVATQNPKQRMHHIPQACQIAEFTHLCLTGRVFPDGLAEAEVIVELPPTIEDENEKDPPLIRVHYRMPTNVIDL